MFRFLKKIKFLEDEEDRSPIPEIPELVLPESVIFTKDATRYEFHPRESLYMGSWKRRFWKGGNEYPENGVYVYQLHNTPTDAWVLVIATWSFPARQWSGEPKYRLLTVEEAKQCAYNGMYEHNPEAFYECPLVPEEIRQIHRL